MFSESAYFLEACLIDEILYALAGCELAIGVLLLDALLAAT
jgi:hypothetical protein